MGKQDFFDRKEEFRKLDCLLSRDVSESACGIILYAATGVGKTMLINNYAQEKATSIHLVPVEIPSINNFPVQNGLYFERVFRCFLKSIYGTEELTPTQSLGYTALENVSVGLNALAFGISASVVNKIESSENPNLYRYKWLIKELTEQEEYKKKPVIFELQNVQRMDDESYFLLQNFVQNAKNCFVIFEYTVDETNTAIRVHQFYDSFTEYIDLEAPYELRWLPLADLKKVMKETSYSYTDSEILRIYSENAGNILAMKILEPREEVSLPVSSSIDNAVQHCSRFEQFTLLLLSLSGGQIAIDTLTEMLSSPKCCFEKIYQLNGGNAVSTLSRLVQRELISIDNILVSIHDSVSLSVMGLAFTEIGYLAYSVLVDYYTNQEYTDFSFYLLLTLHIKYRDENVYQFLRHLKKHLRIHQLSDALTLKLIELDRTLHGICLNSGLYEKTHLLLLDIFLGSAKYTAVNTLLHIYSSPLNKLYMLYYFAANAEITSDLNFADEISRAISANSKSSRITLFLNICLLNYTMRTTIGEKSPVLLAEKILHNPEYSTFPELYFVLKTITFYMPNNEAINGLNLCTKAFRDHKRNDYAMMSELTLCTRLAQNGQTAEALNRIHALQNTNYEFGYCNNYMFQNNISAMEILHGNYSHLTIQRLNDALLYPASEYERALMLNNLLIASLLDGENDKADYYATKLSDSKYDAIHTEQFCHIRWTNLLFYCRCRKCEKALYYVHKLQQLACVCEQPDLKEYISCKLQGKTVSKTNRHFFLAQNDYRPTFIGYWQTEVDPTIVSEC